MNILFLTEFFTSPNNPKFSGGVETRTFYTAKYFSLNNEITIFARRKKGEQNFEKHNNLTIYRFGSETNSFAATIKSIILRIIFIYKCVQKANIINIDIVEGSNFVTYLPTIMISKLKKIPKIAWYPDTLRSKWIAQFGIILGTIGELCESIFLKIKWNKMITISNSVKKRLIKNGVNPEAISVIYCGIESTIRKINFNKKNQLLVISRLVKYKRVDWVIRLLNNLKNKLPDLTLTIVGEGPEEKNLKSLAQEYNLNNRITFINNISNKLLEQMITKSQLLIHPSIIEGFGIALLESSKHGVPFISANIPTALELNQELKSGLLFRKNDFEDLIKQTTKILSDNNLYQELSNNGIRNTKRFNWETLSKQTEKIYQKVIQTNLCKVK